MLEGMYAAASSMATNMSNQEIIARNLANLNTSGYKKCLPLLQSFSQVLDELPHETAGVGLADTVTDFTQGELQHTGGGLDVALKGEGFFTVDSPSGLTYTRKGRLCLSDDGTLVTSAGFPVLGEGGEIRIPGQARHTTIDKAGNVLADAQRVGKLQVVTFADLSVLRPTRFTSFQPADPMALSQPARDYEVVQGYLEQANVDVVEEMVKMIVNLRNFQMSQKLLSASDQTLEELTDYAEGR